jgi:hypothetical protein
MRSPGAVVGLTGGWVAGLGDALGGGAGLGDARAAHAADAGAVDGALVAVEAGGTVGLHGDSALACSTGGARVCASVMVSPLWCVSSGARQTLVGVLILVPRCRW